jgi:hypothetical protein
MLVVHVNDRLKPSDSNLGDRRGSSLLQAARPLQFVEWLLGGVNFKRASQLLESSSELLNQKSN